MDSFKKQIEEIVNRETHAWDIKDVDLLITILHPNMVWPWPKDSQSHDPLHWQMELGKFNYNRWKNNWQKLFDTYALIHNKRDIKKIVISKEGDGVFAVVDVDTLWQNPEGNDFHWRGRACKVYTKVNNEWKMISQIGLLEYE